MPTKIISWLFVAPIFNGLENVTILSNLQWIKILLFCCIVSVIIPNLVAFNSNTFVWDFLSSRDQCFPVHCHWHDASQSWLEESELIINWAGGVIRDFKLCIFKFRSCQLNAPFACSESVTFSSKEFFECISWICWCCSAWY